MRQMCGEFEAQRLLRTFRAGPAAARWAVAGEAPSVQNSYSFYVSVQNWKQNGLNLLIFSNGALPRTRLRLLPQTPGGGLKNPHPTWLSRT